MTRGMSPCEVRRIKTLYLNWPFRMPSCLIFDSSVDGGIPSVAAAPRGPATRPLLFASAASIMSFS